MFTLTKYFLIIDGYVLKKYKNWDKLSCLSSYIFLSFGGNERRQKPNIPHLRAWIVFAENKISWWQQRICQGCYLYLAFCGILFSISFAVQPLDHGQAHHMFSRILKLLIFDFFTKFYLFCFSTRNKLFIEIKKAYTILCSPLKIEKKKNNFRRFVDSEFVKNMWWTRY